jgi:hypothetical protein
MKLPAALDDVLLKVISFSKKRSKISPNVYCARCGFEWHDEHFAAEKKRPSFCISCYQRTVLPKPSRKESIVSSAKAKMKKREKENKGKSKLK